MPDRTRNVHVLTDTVAGDCQFPVAMTIPLAARRMTMVRTKVAKSELTFSTPTLAKIAVNAANAADNKAQKSHESNGDDMTFVPQDRDADGRDSGGGTRRWRWAGRP